jgi:hypothetical protein
MVMLILLKETLLTSPIWDRFPGTPSFDLPLKPISRLARSLVGPKHAQCSHDEARRATVSKALFHPLKLGNRELQPVFRGAIVTGRYEAATLFGGNARGCTDYPSHAD